MSSIVIKVTDLLSSFLYIKIFNIPFIIIWVIATGVFCTIRFKFINFRLFKYGIQTLFNLESHNNNGIITHFQATVTTGTVGLGTISGVAIAITIGGPSAVFWMIITGVLGMSIKFAEVVLAFTHRSENTTGGVFYYMEQDWIYEDWQIPCIYLRSYAACCNDSRRHTISGKSNCSVVK